MLRPILRSLLPMALLVLAACNPMAELEDGDAAVAQYHSRFNQSDFNGIWQSASKDFRTTQTREEFDQLFGAIRQKLGAETKTERNTFSINTNNGVTTVSIVQSTIFERGKGDENFVFVRDGENLKLQNYNVDSRALIVN